MNLSKEWLQLCTTMLAALSLDLEGTKWKVIQTLVLLGIA